MMVDKEDNANNNSNTAKQECEEMHTTTKDPQKMLCFCGHRSSHEPLVLAVVRHLSHSWTGGTRFARRARRDLGLGNLSH